MLWDDTRRESEVTLRVQSSTLFTRAVFHIEGTSVCRRNTKLNLQHHNILVKLLTWMCSLRVSPTLSLKTINLHTPEVQHNPFYKLIATKQICWDTWKQHRCVLMPLLGPRVWSQRKTCWSLLSLAKCCNKLLSATLHKNLYSIYVLICKSAA